MPVTTSSQIPQHLPELSPGWHRTSRHGACFMEYASYLAGEPWSDRPDCTDPILAELARDVNDVVSHETRQLLVHDVPRVIGLRAGDVLSYSVALRAIAEGFPIVPPARQSSLAVAVIGILDALRLRGVVDSPAIAAARAVVDAAPLARAEAEHYFRMVGQGATQLVLTGCSLAIRTLVRGVRESGIGDPDAHLVMILRTAIAEAEAQARPIEAERAGEPAGAERRHS